MEDKIFNYIINLYKEEDKSVLLNIITSVTKENEGYLIVLVTCREDSKHTELISVYFRGDKFITTRRDKINVSKRAYHVVNCMVLASKLVLVCEDTLKSEKYKMSRVVG